MPGLGVRSDPLRSGQRVTDPHPHGWQRLDGAFGTHFFFRRGANDPPRPALASLLAAAFARALFFLLVGFPTGGFGPFAFPLDVLR